MDSSMPLLKHSNYGEDPKDTVPYRLATSSLIHKTRSLSTIWELVRNVESTTDLWNQNPHL